MPDNPRHDHTSEAERLMAQILEKVPPATKRPQDCEHPDFAAAVAVARLSDSGTLSVELRVVCVVCRSPMRFLGTPAGWHPGHPTASIDGLEVYLPIEPEGVKVLADSASYTLPAIARKH